LRTRRVGRWLAGASRKREESKKSWAANHRESGQEDSKYRRAIGTHKDENLHTGGCSSAIRTETCWRSTPRSRRFAPPGADVCRGSDIMSAQGGVRQSTAWPATTWLDRGVASPVAAGSFLL